MLVLAAGKSTRIASVAAGLPKPLLEVGGRTVLGGNLTWLAHHGIETVWINVHYRPDTIRAALGDGSDFGLRVRYSHEESILGTAGGWKRVAPEWGGTWLVVYGDNLMRFDIAALLHTHRERGAQATIALFDPGRHVNTRIAGGRVQVAPDGHVAAFVEGDASRHADARFVNAGAYMLEAGVQDLIGPGLQDFGKDVFPQIVPRGCVAGHLMEPAGFCLGLDTPESLELARELVRTHQVTL
ncbi:MAG: nucleotidyltransferase family protein [Gemmatimonadota bacterium]|nr:nucleotidyltransferase family protein [Gemmatimonadota bacterium]